MFFDIELMTLVSQLVRSIAVYHHPSHTLARSLFLFPASHFLASTRRDDRSTLCSDHDVSSLNSD